MKVPNVFARSITIVGLGMMLLGSSTFAYCADTPTQGGHGANRGGSYPVKVVVKLNDQPVAGISVTAMIRKSKTVVTNANGIAAFTLIPGTYTFSASNDSGSATVKAKVVSSTKPLIVQLVLAPKAP